MEYPSGTERDILKYRDPCHRDKVQDITHYIREYHVLRKLWNGIFADLALHLVQKSVKSAVHYFSFFRLYRIKT